MDQFAATAHVETVVCLRRENVNGHVDIDLAVEKLNGKSGTATYEDVKAYIVEKYGFNVSTLYIAQVKDKVGMDKRNNYNFGSGKSRVPNCPPEKEEAIKAAFRHFRMM